MLRSAACSSVSVPSIFLLFSPKILKVVSPDGLFSNKSMIVVQETGLAWVMTTVRGQHGQFIYLKDSDDEQKWDELLALLLYYYSTP